MIYLISGVYLAWTFFNFLARCDVPYFLSRNRSLMNEDKSWSLGEDFEQGYEELSAFVITIPKMPSSHHSQQSVFKGVKAYFNPDFVSDILCPGPSGDLTTILTDDTSSDNIFDESEKIMGGEESTYQCHFVTKNENYIVGIEYPSMF